MVFTNKIYKKLMGGGRGILNESIKNIHQKLKAFHILFKVKTKEFYGFLYSVFHHVLFCSSILPQGGNAIFIYFKQQNK